MDVKVGQRVVRGPDWKWANQDGGEGYVGTVVEVKTFDKPAEGLVTARATVVQWDNGSRCNYRCGVDGKYDLYLLDNGPCAVLHQHVTCDACHENDIKGLRWKCMQCYDFDLCTLCYMSGKHSVDHQFARYDAPNSPKVCVSLRSTSTKILSKGLFKSAEVVRGQDWLWGDQDGGSGSIGKVIEVKNWETDTYRSVAEVKWSKVNKQNVYRVGHKGKVDIKCVKPGDGIYYYPTHLPVLGMAVQDSSPEVVSVSAGDTVRIQLDVEQFKLLQEGHGGWNDKMAELLSQVGTVHSVLENGDLRVRFPSHTWTLNPAVVTKACQYSVGDVVKVIDDMATVHDLQENHGGWVDDIALALGQAGRIIKIFPSGDIRVSVNGRNWTLNPLAIHPAPDENPPEATVDEEGLGLDLDSDMHLKLLALMENPAVIVAGAASGDLSIVKDFLTKHPFEVDHKAAGKAAVHCATVSGNVEILKCLLEFKANVDIQDDDGDTPLHLCAFGDEDEAAKLLCEHGANINLKNGKGATALFIAAVKGHVSVIKVLLQQPDIDLHLEDDEGNTPMHAAVLATRNEVLSILLEAGADPEKINFRLFTPIHDAARIGFLPGMQQFLQCLPTCVNMPKEDGFTPLHLACLNDHLDVSTTLLEAKECKINTLNNANQTSLHVAAHRGHGRIVERLVGFGADLNLKDTDGDTPLHMSMMNSSIDGTCDSPQLKKIKETLSSNDTQVTNNAVIACFLIQEGADPYILNNKGQTVLSVGSTDVAALLTMFIDQKPESKFHGSLCHSDSVDGADVVPAVTTPARSPLAVKAPLPNKSPLLTTKPLLSPVTKLSPVKEPPQAIGVLSTKSLPDQSPVQPRETPQHQISDPSPYTRAASEEECLLCGEPVDVRLMPCGHVILCKECSQRAKKCPQCKCKVTSVEIKEPEVPKCLMCEEELATVTALPCEHKFCPDCCRRMKRCAECKQIIESKEGLPPDCETTLTQGSIFSSVTEKHGVPLCEICCERPRDTALTCGHQFCLECSQKVDNCPICRRFIQHRIQLFQ